MNKHIKLLITFLIISIVTAISVEIFQGCNKKSGNENGVVTITFWHSFVASTIPALDKLIARFEKEHPGIKIDAQYVPTGDPLIQKLTTAIQSNTAPDISWIHSDFLDKLAQSDVIYKMDHFINGPGGMSKSEMEDFFPALLKSASWRDTLYAMPMEATTLAFLYNKNLFKEAGLDPDRPPQNWDELKEYAAKLTKDKNGDGKTDQYGFYIPAFPAEGPLSIWMVLQWTPFLWQAGGSEINQQQTHVLFNSDAGVKALSFWKQIYDMENFSGFTLSHDIGFKSGVIAMIMDGPWDLPELEKINKFNWAVTSLPAGPAKRATYIAGESIAIFKQSRHPEAAWEFVKWVTSPEVQAFFSEQSGYLPVKKSVLKIKEYQDFMNSHPHFKPFVDQLEIGQGRANIDYHHVEINQYIAEAVEKTIIGNINPKTALDEAAAKSDRLLQSKKAMP